jgi:ABC-type antimicrobial peptide transport system permease subunit
LIGQTTQPLVRDLNSDAGRVALGLEGRDLEGVSVVPFRVRDGEDASCLNLNRAQAPRLLGVRPRLLKERGAFTFTKASAGLGTAAGWDLLNHKTADNSVPAIGDAASIQWALGKKIGDTLTYKDAHGNDFQVRLVGAIANSILQGNLVIAEEQFEKLFPGEYGYRMFLIDAPSNAAEKTAETLSRALVDVGMEILTSTDRLAAFNAVQNTYLSTFQVLGGLGLLLGSVGLGVVVLRNVLERRSELALLLAVGFRSPRLRWLVLSEHGALLILGLGLGVFAAAIAVAPAILSPSAAPFPYSSLAITLGGVLLSGALWTWLATHWALRGKLLETLRNN